MNVISDSLVVIDMQNDFITGVLGTKEAQNIVQNVINKIEEYKNAGKTICYTKDTHFNEEYYSTHEAKYLPIKHCIFGTEGREIDRLIMESLPSNAVPISKFAFGNTKWEFLSKCSSVEIVGLCTDICVISNALIMRSELPEIDIVVDASCCAGSTVERHKAALEVMKSCHIEVINE